MAGNRFVESPVLSICIAVAVVFVGLIALNGLAIEKFPDIAPPTVRVSATYRGASAETVQKAVVIPLEESINGVENMIYMESDATPGSASISVYFKQGTNPDQAAVNVQNKVSEATGLLPSEVTQIGVTTRKRQTSILSQVAVFSPDDSFDRNFIANYLRINILPELQRIDGVGDIQVYGGTYGMRIWLNPDTMAHYGLIPSDISAVLADQNIEASVGSFGENSSSVFTYTLKYRGRYETPEEFGELIVRANSNGEELRLKDVARIELGREDYTHIGAVDHHPGTSMSIYQVAGSNATQINLDIEAKMKDLALSFPEGLDYVFLRNTNDFLFASIEEVVKTLLQAIVLVVLVVFFFLQDFKLTLIPTLALFVSLIGTFIFIYLFGFSLNLLTLFALILVIGTVVDDAIVVVEAVQTDIDAGETDVVKATQKAMSDITAAIVTSTIVFMAVFIPISFMPGTSGIFYRQFGLTMAAAVGLSLLCALTLSPALCAVLLRNKGKEGGFIRFFKKIYYAFYNALEKFYRGVLKFMLHGRWLSYILIVLALVGAGLLMRSTKTGLVPQEDTGAIFVNFNTSPSNNTLYTDSVLDEICAIVDTYPEVRVYSRTIGNSMTGGSGSSSGSVTLRLENWSKRKGSKHSSFAVMKRLQDDLKSVTGAKIFVMQPSMIDGYGLGNAVQLYLQDKTGGDIKQFYNIAQNFLTELNSRPEVLNAYTSYQVDYVQYMLDVDASKCKRAGVNAKDVLDVISGYYGSIYASNIIRFSKVYKVLIQAEPDSRLDENSLEGIYFRNGDEMALVSDFVTITKTTGPENMSRFNLFNCISANITIQNGYSSGEVIKAIAEVAKETLPDGFGYEYGGTSREESTTNNTILILVICVILIYLLLCSLYESFFVPLAVILSVPFGVFGCFVGAKVFGVENNIYLQTGMIMVIGLLCKTAILITEYAQVRREAGMELIDAASDAAKVRLRPILMTVLTLLFGMLPLLYATGAGANGDLALGSAVVGGMLIGTVFLLLVVPALFVDMQKLQEKYGFTFGKKNTAE